MNKAIGKEVERDPELFESTLEREQNAIKLSAIEVFPRFLWRMRDIVDVDPGVVSERFQEWCCP